MLNRKRDKKTPFTEGCMLDRVWIIALRGASLKELSNLCKKEGTQLPWMLRKLRGGKHKGWTWNVMEVEGKIKVYNARRA